MTAVSTWSLTGARIGVSPFETIVTSTQEHEAYRQRIQGYGGTSDDLVYVATDEGAALFTAETLNAIRAATAELADLEYVSEVRSLTELFHNSSSSGTSASPFGGVSRRRYWPEHEEEQEFVDLEALRAAMLADSDVASGYLSEDGTVQAMVMVVNQALELGPREQIRVRDEIMRIVERHGLGTESVHLAGLLGVSAWTIEALFVCVFVLFPISVLIVGVLVYVLFHRIRLALLTVAIALVSLVWSFGVTQWIFGSLNLLVASVPGIVMTIASADVVHLVSAFRRELRTGADNQQALRTALSQVGEACLLTSLTTSVGFLSLLVIPALAIRQLAVAASVGVAGALLLVVTVVPIVLAHLPPKQRPGRAGPWLEAALKYGADLSWRLGAKTPRVVVLGALALLLLGIGFATKLHFEPDLPRRFAAGHPLRQSVVFFEEKLGGASSFDLLIAGEEEEFLSPEVLTSLAAARDRIEALPRVLSTYSLLDIFEETAQLGGMDTSPVPQTSGAAASRLFTLERLAGRDISSILGPDRDRTRMIVRLRGGRLREGYRISEQIEGIVAESLNGAMEVQAVGFVPLVGLFVENIVIGQLQGLALCYIAVTLILSFAARSFRVGVLTSLPNLLPLALLSGLIALTLDPADSDLIMIGTVTLCLAVDNAIHLVHRYRVELGRRTEREVALERTLHSSGGAILFTTFALCFGFGAFAFSSYLTSWIFGTYLLFGLLTGMLANLLVLPALIRLGWLRPPPLVE